jgi:hypothetical protein
MISPRIFENKTLYALEEDRIKFGCRSGEGVAMVRNNRRDVTTLGVSFGCLYFMCRHDGRVDLFRDLRARSQDLCGSLKSWSIFEGHQMCSGSSNLHTYRSLLDYSSL